LAEKGLIAETSARVASRIAADHSAVLNPDVEKPFTDAIDAVNRLLPYHVFLQPKEDLAPLLCNRKGKTKVTDFQEVEGDTS
jgi:putative heme iron utilization protein